MTKITENSIETFAIETLQALGWDYVHGLAIAPGAEHADKALILNLDVQYPNIEMLIEFEKMAEVWFEKKKANRNQIRTLTCLRDTLLPKLMSGDVRVKDA